MVRINKSFFHQIKLTAMAAKFAVVGSNLIFVDFSLRNYFRFSGDIFHECLENFCIKLFYDLINSLDEDLKFTFENPSRTLNFLDIQLKIVNNTLVFDIYYKQKNSFNYSFKNSSNSFNYTVAVTLVIPRIILHFFS